MADEPISKNLLAINFSKRYSNRKSLEERFWSKVSRPTPNGCWLWTGAVSSAGYGQLGPTRDWPSILAHRLSFIVYVRPIAAGVLACHKCDNKLCVRPDHLFAGSSKDNTQDMIQKARHRFYKLPRCKRKLSNEEVSDIQILAHFLTIDQLAPLFDVHRSSVYRATISCA